MSKNLFLFSHEAHSSIYRTLKRMKAYGNLEDTRPTLRNKPSGLKPDWCHSASQTPTPYTHSRSSSALSIATLPVVPWSSLPEPDHTSSLLAVSPPSSFRGSSVPVFHGDLVTLADERTPVYPKHLSKVCGYLLLSFRTVHSSPRLARLLTTLL